MSRSGDQTRVLLRGAVSAHFATADDVVHLDGNGAATWVERTLIGVTRIRLEVDASAEPTTDDDLLVAGGLVRLSTAEQPPSPAEPDRLTAEAEIETAIAIAAAALDPDRPDDTRDTRAGGVDPATLGTPLPGISGQPPAPPVTARPVARLLVPQGESVDVDRVVLVGRAPEVRRADGVEPPRLVPVAGPHQEISSTHLEVRPGSGADHGSAVVTDLGSTNGTLLVQPGLPPEDLKAGIGVQLLPGAVLDLGDGVDDPGGQPMTAPPSDLDRRFYAFTLDRLLAWTIDARRRRPGLVLPDRPRPGRGRDRGRRSSSCCSSARGSRSSSG